MKLKFYWYISEAYRDGVLRPACNCIAPRNESDEYLSNYLMDDGGQIYLDTIPWLKQGVEKIRTISRHDCEYIDWSRDAWGAGLSADGAKIYSLQDDRYFQNLTLVAFEKALITWIAFLQQKAEVDLVQEVDLS